MCGICGIVNFNSESNSENEVRQMMDTIKHRGPDDEGVFNNNGVSLGFVRLSIIDLSKDGHQPMISADERHVIIFNGEIYNYIENRLTLESKGYVFRTKSDTEVLLNMFIEYGDACLDYLNGMFAFVIYDRKEKNIFGARDRFGIKPFYYAFINGEFIFASEIKAIRKIIQIPLSVNEDALFNYFVFNRTDYNEKTFYNEINKLPHGHSFSFNKEKGLKFRRWYNLRERVEHPFASVDEFKETFLSSIDLRLRSDVPIGACLSGGLDSSTIVSAISEKFGINDIHTYSAVYKERTRANEKPFIDSFRHRLGNMHFIYPTAKTLLTDLDDFLSTHDEPFSTLAIYAQYKVMQRASENVTVILDGQGADEYLAGYDYFYSFYLKEMMMGFRMGGVLSEMLTNRIDKQLLKQLGMTFYLMMPSKFRTRLRINEKKYFNPEFIRERVGGLNISDFIYDSNTLTDSLLNHFEYKLEHLLKWEDYNSMRFSIESRVPFLDYRLVEGALKMPAQFKFRKGASKMVIREAFGDLIPAEILRRREKIGFATPSELWFKDKNVQNMVSDILNSRLFRSNAVINPDEAIIKFRQHVDGKISIDSEIWKWVNFYFWNERNLQL